MGTVLSRVVTDLCVADPDEPASGIGGWRGDNAGR